MAGNRIYGLSVIPLCFNYYFASDSLFKRLFFIQHALQNANTPRPKRNRENEKKRKKKKETITARVPFLHIIIIHPLIHLPCHFILFPYQ